MSPDRAMDGIEVKCPDCGVIVVDRAGDECEWCDEGVLEATEDGQDDAGANSEDQTEAENAVFDAEVLEDDRSTGSGATAAPVAVDGGPEDHNGDLPDERPEPPVGIAQYILDGLNRQSPEDLRTIAEYAQRLAAWEANQQATERADSDEGQDVVAEREAVDDERPDGVPGKASVVVKEIDGSRYEYWQWWEDGGTKSQYKGPATRDRN